MITNVSKLIDSSAIVTTGAGVYAPNVQEFARTFQAVVSGTGAVTASLTIDASLDNVNFITIGRIDLTGTTSATDGFSAYANWAFYRANLTAITGTSALVTVLMGA
jgi:hypothetical protein